MESDCNLKTDASCADRSQVCMPCILPGREGKGGVVEAQSLADGQRFRPVLAACVANAVHKPRHPD